jgi:hypothetical protein
MSKFIDRLSDPRGLVVDDLLWAAPVAVDFPCLAQILCGKLGEKGEEIIPPMTLKIFSKAGQLRFSVAKTHEPDRAYFGHIKRPEAILECVEAALEGNETEEVIYASNGAGRKKF